jgi:hypothetical protein
MVLKQAGIASGKFPRDLLGQALIALVGFIVSVRMNYPGLMSNDSVAQYSQALSFAFNDWAPPIMAFIWGLTNDWIPGPLGMLLLFCSLYWGGLLLLSLSIARTAKPVSIGLLLLGFAPFAIGSVGTIWKDVFHAVITLFAVGLISFAERNGALRRSVSAVAIVLLLIAAMARFNALAALPPLLWLAIGRPRLNNWKIPTGLAVLSLLVLPLSSSLSYSLLRAEHSGVYSSLLIYDLGGITNATGVNVFGQSFAPEEEKQLKSTCYDTIAWDSYAWGRCAFVMPALKASGLWASDPLVQSWIKAIKTYPAAYAKHRLAHWWQLMWHPQALLIADMQKNPWGFEFHKSSLRRLLERVTENMENWVFYKPGFWLFLAIALIPVAARYGSGRSRDIVIALNLSSILYLVSYLPLGVATDFRYAYWSILATWLSLPFLGALFARGKRARSTGRRAESATEAAVHTE